MLDRLWITINPGFCGLTNRKLVSNALLALFFVFLAVVLSAIPVSSSAETTTNFPSAEDEVDVRVARRAVEELEIGVVRLP